MRVEVRWDNRIRSTGDLTIEHLREANRAMGFYIQVPEHFGKAEQIEALYDGMIIPKPNSFDLIPLNMALIVVVRNQQFEAAGFAYDEEEFVAFTDPGDLRPKKFVLINRVMASELSGYSRNAKKD